MRRGRPARAGAVLAAALALGLVGPGTAAAPAADQVRVRAQVDRLELPEGEDLRLSVEVSGPSLERVGPPDISTLDDFTTTGGPSVSTRYQWINGVASSSKTYTYFLTPKRTGKLRVPSLAVLVQGRTYRTRPIDVNVLPRGALRSPMQPPAPQPFGGPQGRPGRGGGPGRGVLPPIALRVRSEVDTRTAYVGQQITLRLVVDAQTEILNEGAAENPTFPGFWAEEIKLPDQRDVRRVTLDGEPWGEFTVMKRALFPTTAGTLTIPSIPWQIQVRRRSSDPLESFFFTPTEVVTRRSEPIDVTVKALPTAGRPAGFSGAVGSFTLSVDADRTTSQVNDAIGLKVRVAGEGSLGGAEAPVIADLPDFKRYDPKVSSSTSVQGDRLRSEKTWDYVVIPLAPGPQGIPPITFSYFDPGSREYKTLHSQPLTIQVARGTSEGGAAATVGVAQSDVRPQGHDIHYLRLAPGGLRDRSRPLYRSALFLILLFMPVAADVSLWAWARTRDTSPAAARNRRERRARSMARRRLREARRQMKPASARAFYASVAQAMTDYVGDKFGIPGAGLTHPRIEELLTSGGAPDDLRAAFHRGLEACDFARFAPSSSSEEEMRRALESAEGTLTALERTLQ